MKLDHDSDSYFLDTTEIIPEKTMWAAYLSRAINDYVNQEWFLTQIGFKGMKNAKPISKAKKEREITLLEYVIFSDDDNSKTFFYVVRELFVDNWHSILINIRKEVKKEREKVVKQLIEQEMQIASLVKEME